MERVREFSWCCGAGGGVRSAFPEFALFAARERIAEAQATGAEALVTSCPWCESNLEDAVSASDGSFNVISLVELVEKAL
jgi:Fe-S oxidoreductase